MSKRSFKPVQPLSSILGTGERNQVGGPGTPVTRTVMPQPKGTKATTRSPGTNRTPTGRSIGGNW